jgi:hypothetical protein
MLVWLLSLTLFKRDNFLVGDADDGGRQMRVTFLLQQDIAQPDHAGSLASHVMGQRADLTDKDVPSLGDEGDAFIAQRDLPRLGPLFFAE